jgi:hypothetical protein
MRNFSGFLKGVAFATAMVAMTFSGYAQQPVKRVLVEQFTGAWCGWCPDGSVRLQQLIESNPENVIAAVHHNGDGMVVAELDNALGTFVSGYPAGTINRIFFPGEAKVGIDRGQWTSRALEELEKPAVVGVELTNRQYNSSTRQLTITLNAKFESAISGDLRFNLYVIEDSVRGTGAMYDQRNFLNTQAGHPMAGKGDPIKGYYHRSVVRQMVDGPWGTQGSIPAGVTAGTTYSKTYTVTLPSGWNADRVSLIGVVQKYGSAMTQREILNSVEMSLTKAPNVYATASIGEEYTKIPRGATTSNTITVTNNSTFAYPANLSVDLEKSNLPEGWSATVEPAQVTVPAGGTATATVKITSGSNAGLAEVVVSVLPAPAPTEGTGKPASTSMFALTSDAKYVMLSGLSNGSSVFSTTLENMPAFKDDAVVIPNNPEILAGYPLASFDVAIIPIDYFGRGNLGGDAIFNNVMPGMIQNMMDAGKKVFIMSELDAYYAANANGSDEARALYRNTFGIENNGDPVMRVTVNSNGAITGVVPFPIVGSEGDVIGNGINMQGNTSNTSYTIYTDILKKSVGSQAVPILYYGTDKSKIAGFRVEKGDAKAVYLSFGLNAIANGDDRAKLFNRVMSYLTGVATGVAGISTSNDLLNYDQVKINTTKEMVVTIMSNGEAPLEISEMNISGDGSSNFTIKNAPTMPLTLAAGQELEVTIEFTPNAEGMFEAQLDITSNAGDVTSVFLSGEGTTGDPNSVHEFTAGSSAFLTANVSPNPANEKAMISYQIKGDAPQTVTLSVIDALGNTVQNFGSKTLAPGSYTQDINSAAIASGSYRLVVRSAEAAIQVPFVIAR